VQFEVYGPDGGHEFDTDDIVTTGIVVVHDAYTNAVVRVGVPMRDGTTRTLHGETARNFVSLVRHASRAARQARLRPPTRPDGTPLGRGGDLIWS
jgi:hypothetical protein